MLRARTRKRKPNQRFNLGWYALPSTQRHSKDEEEQAMKRHIIPFIALGVLIVFLPVGNDVDVNVGVSLKHREKPVVQTNATKEQKSENKIMAMRYAEAGWGWGVKQRQCIYKLFMKESKFDHLAKNLQGSSAFGIAQMLKETSKEPEVQILRAYRYIVHRYDNPCSAWAHHQRRNWY